MKKKSYLALCVLAAAFLLSSCEDDIAVTDDLLTKSATMYQQYTGFAPGTGTFISAGLTTRNLPANYEEDVDELQILLAQQINVLSSLSKSSQTDDLIISYTNALMEIMSINLALQTSPPTITELPFSVANIVNDTLREVERHIYQSIGEQALIGIPEPTTAIPSPSQLQIDKTQQKLLYEANKAALFKENIRADLLRIASVTFGNYAQEIGTPASQQLAPIPAPTAAVASPFSESGMLGAMAQGLRSRRRFVDPDNRFLPPACDNAVLDLDTCLVNPVVVISPNDPIEPISNTEGIPSDLALVGNEIISDVNAAVSGFLATPSSGPVSAALVANVKTLEIECAKLLTYFRLIAQTDVTQDFIEQLEDAQLLLTVLAALLGVDSPINFGSIPTPQLNGINLSQIPSVPATPHTEKPFTNKRPPATTLLDSVVDGVLAAERAMHIVIGENIQTLHSLTVSGEVVPPSSNQIAKIIRNYENTAVNADNNYEPERAAILRIIGKAYELTTASPAGLPVPAATAVIQDPLSQAGFAATIAQRAHLRRRDVDPNLAGYPESCDDRTWDANTCPLVP